MIEKKNELRIGNIIDVDGIRNKVEYINTHSVGLDILPDVPFGSCRLQPLNLSIETILLCGFVEQDDEGDAKYFEKEGVRFGIKWIDGDEFYLYHNSDAYIILTEIKSFHHLQNLILDLEGFEI